MGGTKTATRTSTRFLLPDQHEMEVTAPETGKFEVKRLPDAYMDAVDQLEKLGKRMIQKAGFVFNSTKPLLGSDPQMYRRSGRRMLEVETSELTNRVLQGIVEVINGATPTRFDEGQAIPNDPNLNFVGPPTLLMAEDGVFCPHQWPHCDGLKKTETAVLLALSDRANFLVWDATDNDLATIRCEAQPVTIEKCEFVYFYQMTVHSGGCYTSFNARAYWSFTSESRGSGEESTSVPANLVSCSDPPCVTCFPLPNKH